jgi:hypothetical protein
MNLKLKQIVLAVQRKDHHYLTRSQDQIVALRHLLVKEDCEKLGYQLPSGRECLEFVLLRRWNLGEKEVDETDESL